MYHNAFPTCPVNGPIEPPVPYGHLGLRGGIPQKCNTCDFLFEGSCTRAAQTVGRYLVLGHGFCGVSGPTDPVFFENHTFSSKVTVPRKCSTCRYLKIDMIRGLFCSKDPHIWGDFPRSLDWGTWQPDHIFVNLPFPKITTHTMGQAVQRDDLMAFIKEYRRVNVGSSMAQAKEDFEWLRQQQRSLHPIQEDTP